MLAFVSIVVMFWCCCWGCCFQYISSELSYSSMYTSFAFCASFYASVLITVFTCFVHIAIQISLLGLIIRQKCQTGLQRISRGCGLFTWAYPDYIPISSHRPFVPPSEVLLWPHGAPAQAGILAVWSRQAQHGEVRGPGGRGRTIWGGIGFLEVMVPETFEVTWSKKQDFPQ